MGGAAEGRGGATEGKEGALTAGGAGGAEGVEAVEGTLADESLPLTPSVAPLSDLLALISPRNGKPPGIGGAGGGVEDVLFEEAAVGGGIGGAGGAPGIGGAEVAGGAGGGGAFAELVFLCMLLL